MITMRYVVMAIAISGCAQERIVYQPVPAWVIPKEPELPTLKAEELRCLSDDAYVRLVTRDRLRASDQMLLRSLLGAENE